MWPVLFSFGSIELKTKSLFFTLAFLTTGFVFWKKTKEEHYQPEQAFDAFLLSALIGLASGRVGFIILHWQQLGFNLWHWLDIFGRSGYWLDLGLLGAALFLWRQAKKQKWDVFEVLDFWFLALSAGLVLQSLGNFTAGTGFGFETNLPWGMVFPGVFVKHHPVQLYLALFYLGLYIYLYWAEYHYRTFAWYRAGKKTAQTGFLTSVFLMANGLITLLLRLVRPAQVMLMGVGLDWLLGLILFGWGLVLLLQRSGRELPRLKKTIGSKINKKKQSKL